MASKKSKQMKLKLASVRPQTTGADAANEPHGTTSIALSLTAREVHMLRFALNKVVTEMQTMFTDPATVHPNLRLAALEHNLLFQMSLDNFVELARKLREAVS